MRNISAFSFAAGSGIGICVQGDDLLVTAVHAWFGRLSIAGELRIPHYRSRPPAEWAREYKTFLEKLKLAHLAATVVLPRVWTTVRVLLFPQMKRTDVESAIELQIDSLHPYSDAEIVCRWRRLAGDGQILVAIADRSELQAFASLMRQAGIKVASFTVSAAAIYSALRLHRSAIPAFAGIENDGFIAEVYAELGHKPLYSISLEKPPANFERLLCSEFRLDPDYEIRSLKEYLPRAQGTFSSCTSYAAALLSASHLAAAPLNLLPKAERAANSRLMYAPTAVLAALLLLCAIVYRVQASLDRQSYRRRIDLLIAQTEPNALRTQALRQETGDAISKIAEIDKFRDQSRADLRALNELSRVLAAPAYLATLDLSRSGIAISGHAKSAAGLLKQVDSSSQFQNSAFMGDIATGPDGESFRLKADRREGQ